MAAAQAEEGEEEVWRYSDAWMTPEQESAVVAAVQAMEEAANSPNPFQESMLPDASQDAFNLHLLADSASSSRASRSPFSISTPSRAQHVGGMQPLTGSSSPTPSPRLAASSDDNLTGLTCDSQRVARDPLPTSSASHRHSPTPSTREASPFKALPNHSPLRPSWTRASGEPSAASLPAPKQASPQPSLATLDDEIASSDSPKRQRWKQRSPGHWPSQPQAEQSAARSAPSLEEGAATARSPSSSTRVMPSGSPVHSPAISGGLRPTPSTTESAPLFGKRPKRAMGVALSHDEDDDADASQLIPATFPGPSLPSAQPNLPRQSMVVSPVPSHDSVELLPGVPTTAGSQSQPSPLTGSLTTFSVPAAPSQRFAPLPDKLVLSANPAPLLQEDAEAEASALQALAAAPWGQHEASAMANQACLHYWAKAHLARLEMYLQEFGHVQS
ncbi:uncharacterized protein MONBRDRAFT_5019 [Monosiga brevicollis MX1]|uniref:Uncharacterized protein n=1 Tax=Monosiga brevicollis TaxID=81824 RepID=A9UPN4_MONBE|nr:uncharacterized protein MONBRDRAFT_5019 [Monosiga brevicollis MX1]EDQ92453.1 predicted protein [Monosiga brevicollis MX1]|eukprot:XP_001742215.1 hypothetical protein [Monosiga brevicollis MX1]